MQLEIDITLIESTPLAPYDPADGAPSKKCLHELFEEQADANADAPALIWGEKTLSYAELDERANRLARYLVRQGVGPGQFVGLCLERSELPIIAILACLKAGGAYVPLDPALPQERVAHILGEAEIGVLVTETHLAGRFADIGARAKLVALDAAQEEVAREIADRLPRRETGVRSEDACYVLYTSGSTGRPKGVVAEHRNVTHFVEAFNRICSTTPDDRVFQGFALSFDGSVEEIWMAFSNGSALVVAGKDAPRFGNDLARYLTSAGITYFSTVPTMLSTMTEDAPTLRRLVVSGEVCPPELVARWAKDGCCMLNVYGPTEATVNTTAAVCIPGKPITVGRPIDGYTALILDANGEPVAPGEQGELYIGGPGLARGYLKQPELTERAFIERNSERLYKTGDLVRLNDEGELEFFGRIDGQVKIRGFRVELAEIESVLREADEIAAAAVRKIDREDGPSLAAYVVLADGAAELDRGRVLAALRSRLPAYMIPATLDVVESLPLLVSGKVDRKALPEPRLPLVASVEEGEAAMTPLEEKIAKAWASVFQLGKVGPEQNFFLDLGGHSLLAAKAVTVLRTEADLHVPVRGIYAFPTVRKLAEHLEALGKKEKSAEAAPAPAQPAEPRKAAPKPSLLFTAGQAAAILILAAFLSAPLVVMMPPIIDLIQGRATLLDTLLYLAGISFALWPAMVLVGIGSKWLIIGRYRPGVYPLYGGYYFRWWLASRLQALSGAGFFIGTPLMSVYYRAMGAKVGENCALDTALCSAWDLVAIGNDVSIAADTQLLGAKVENGALHIGSVSIGDRCFVGLHSCLGLNVSMGDDSKLDDQSFLPDGDTIPAGEGYRGSPARKADVPVPEGAPLRPSKDRIAVFAGAQLLSGMALAFIGSVPTVALTLIFLLYVPSLTALNLLLIAVPAIPALIVFNCIWIAVCKAIVLPIGFPGVYDRYSLDDLRYWLAAGLMRATRAAMLPVFTTIYLPPFMRLLGARIGEFSEMSTIFSFLPELMTAGDGSFFADGSIVGGRRTHCGRFAVGANSIGNRSFIGNSAILPTGASVGDNCLLGVLSSPPDATGRIPDCTDWLGSPGFNLPNRQKVAGFGDSVTYRPTNRLYAERAVIDACRILIPAYLGALLGVGGMLAMLWANQLYGVWIMAALAVPLSFAMAGVAVAVVVALKWAVMGRFKPVIVPLWSRYVWFNEMVNGAYESIMAPVVGFFFGTPVAAMLLRLLGCKIGRHCYIGSSLFSEFDLVRIGDHVALNGGAIIQNHLFEDRIMKSSYIDIKERCAVGNMAVVLYDTRMEEGAVLGPMSLLMKGETMPANSAWHGIPTVQG
jgi:non-ribosomal peptide synthetase-like protein